MLILPRSIGQTIIIGDDISITVVSIQGYQVKLGVNAPRNVGVHRDEVQQRIKDKEVIN